jgi:AcrR family transcriptional regulator
MSDLEERTGLRRSSLYLAFGSKRELFRSAVDSYVKEVLDPLLAPMELGAADLRAIEMFLSGVKAIVGQARGHGRRGCLMVNTVAELATRDDEAASLSIAFRDRLHDAFVRALEGAAVSGEIASETLGRRADVLTAATFGIWLTARIDPVAAASLCSTMSSEVESWRYAAGGASRRTR